MSIEVFTEIEGLDELEDALVNGAPRMAKKFLGRVHKKAGEILVESASEKAPYQEGDLAGEIYANTTTNKDGMYTRVGPTKQVFWGLIQEIGSAEANVPALHWLEHSAEEVQDQVLDVYVQAIDDGLNEMKGGK